MKNDPLIRRFVRLGTQLFPVWFGLILTVWTCDRPVQEPTAGKVGATELAAIRVTPTNVRLAVGQSQQLHAVLGDAAGNMLPVRMAKPGLVVGPGKEVKATMGDSMGRTGRIVTWRSNQPTLADIGPDGRVTALAIGEATVTAVSEGLIAKAIIIITGTPTTPVVVMPSRASLFVGEKLQLGATLPEDKGGASVPIEWHTDKADLATVSRSGLVKAVSAGTVAITARGKGSIGTAVIDIKPVAMISGLDFPGNAGVHSSMRFEFVSPLAAYPATYIWRVYPRQQQSYFTAFFWGNNGEFYPSKTYYGFHPYPDWKTSYQHFWEIAAAPGGDFVSSSHVVYNRWYIQVAICRKSGDSIAYEFYWDWPDVSKVVRRTGKPYDDPPRPGLIVGDAPWNPGNEVWNGVLRGFQFYDTALATGDIRHEIDSPGSVREPWYLNLNPTPMDIADKSGHAHHPKWVGIERPSKWIGAVAEGTIVGRTVDSR